MVVGIVSLFGFILVFLVSIAVMIYGWGLEPQSWWWIIGGGIFLKGIIVSMEQVAKCEAKKKEL